MITITYNAVVPPTAVNICSENVQSVILLRSNRAQLLCPIPAAFATMTRRHLCVQPITKNLKLVTEDQRKFEKDPKTLRLTQNSSDRPLVLILSWLLGKPKHLSKYAKLYIDQGFDVLITEITPWQLLWPAKGSQKVALDLVTFLASNDYYKQTMVHGFSVGGYIWGEAIGQMENDRARFQPVIDRIVGQVWDSAADITEIPQGVPRAVFPKNAALQRALHNYMMYHMKTFHETATRHYIRSSQLFHTNIVHAPALFFVSKTDPVGAESSNRRVVDNWISMGIDVTWKCFDRSPHVGHFMKHRDEYISYLMAHLQKVNMIKYPELLRAKL